MFVDAKMIQCKTQDIDLIITYIICGIREGGGGGRENKK